MAAVLRCHYAVPELIQVHRSRILPENHWIWYKEVSTYSKTKRVTAT